MHTYETVEGSHRVLIIDDNPRIHEDIAKILCPAIAPNDLAADEAAIFGDVPVAATLSEFVLDSAYQGQEGLALVEKALAERRPYAMAFVDLRMPPGWDGIETIRHIWQRDPELQVVICTAYSDHTWSEIIQSLGKTDSLLILKKPFDNVEVLQLAHALTKKWFMTCQARAKMAELEARLDQHNGELERVQSELQAAVRRSVELEKRVGELEAERRS